MNERISDLKVVILCGGRGERLHPITNDIPKPLLKIKDKPILSYIIEHLAQYNFHNLIFATGYKSNKIVDLYFNENLKKKIIQGYKQARKYSWQNTCSQLKSLILEGNNYTGGKNV